MKFNRIFRYILILLILLSISAIAQDASGDSTAAVSAASAGELKAMSESLQTNLNIVWTCVAAFLVFFMQAGFAMVESGFTQAKNTVNIMMKNLMDFSVGSLAFFILGFGLMFGTTNGFFGTDHFLMAGADITGKDWDWSFLIFQTVFAATAATIVSGAMAERTKFVSYLVYSFIVSALIYPIFGSWAWGSLFSGSGWLENMGFVDFAGSTVVHSLGGWIALAGAILLGPRIGKYDRAGNAKAIPGHNITIAALGVFILWFGWFGFNPGSTTFGDGDIGRIAVTTNLAAAAGAFFAMMTSWVMFKKPDGSMALNGALAGLVAITAGCANVSPIGSIIIGAGAGILVVISVRVIDTILKIDDPVGAVSVHAVCGAFGTLMVGLLDVSSGFFYGGGLKLLGVQAIGVGTGFIWAFGLGFILFFILKKTIGIRVSPEEELRGLDVGEHGMEGYYGFQIFTTQ